MMDFMACRRLLKEPVHDLVFEPTPVVESAISVSVVASRPITKKLTAAKRDKIARQNVKRNVSEVSQLQSGQAKIASDISKKEYEALKIANSLLGIEENKRDTKLKINSIIREIDYCIAQLSD